MRTLTTKFTNLFLILTILSLSISVTSCVSNKTQSYKFKSNKILKHKKFHHKRKKGYGCPTIL